MATVQWGQKTKKKNIRFTLKYWIITRPRIYKGRIDGDSYYNM